MLTTLSVFMQLAMAHPFHEEDQGELRVLPGFEPSELAMSVRAVVDTAQECVARASQPSAHSQVVPPSEDYFPADLVDGTKPEPLSRFAEYDCGSEPVNKCSFLYVWAPDHPTLAYATVQCSAVEGGKSELYTVTISNEIHGAKKESKRPKGSINTSINFYTNSFPGTNTWLSMIKSRSKDVYTTPPTILQFDSYENQSLQHTDLFTSEEVLSLFQFVEDSVCTAVQAPACTPASNPPVASEDPGS